MRVSPLNLKMQTQRIRRNKMSYFNEQPLQLTLFEAIQHLQDKGKSSFDIEKALGLPKGYARLIKARKLLKFRNADRALAMLNCYNILLVPYSSRAELENIVEAEKTY